MQMSQYQMVMRSLEEPGGEWEDGKGVGARRGMEGRQGVGARRRAGSRR